MEKAAVKSIYSQTRFLATLYRHLPKSLVPLIRCADLKQIIASLYLIAVVVRRRLAAARSVEVSFRKLKNRPFLQRFFVHPQRFKALIKRSLKDPDQGRLALLKSGRALALSLRVLFYGGNARRPPAQGSRTKGRVRGPAGKPKATSRKEGGAGRKKGLGGRRKRRH